MNHHKQMVYVVWGEDQYTVSTTHDLSFDLIFWSQRHRNTNFAPLTDYLPFGLVGYLLKKLNIDKLVNKNILLEEKSSFSLCFKKIKKIDEMIAEIKCKCDKILIARGFNIIQYKANKILYIKPYLLPTEVDLAIIQDLLQGRILLYVELERAVNENGYLITCPLENILQYLYLAQKIEKLPAVTLMAHGEFYCNRCGGMNKIEKTYCDICGEDCYYCEDCLSLGAAHWCDTILAAENNQINSNREVMINFNFKLSKAQTFAFEGLRDFIVQQSRPNILIWAVCGAGKTEISFSAIKEVLQRGGKVLYAIPRRDVVIELESRIKKAFPGERLVALYGGSDFKYKDADIVLATTHQTIRFYKAFDLVILDEADAFPYSGSMMLYDSLERARKNNGQTIYMSATPDKSILKKKPLCIKVPVRHHGRPLPVPRILIDKSKEIIAKEIVQFINNSKEEGYQVFIFVPTVAKVQKVGEYLKNLYQEQIQYSYAGDKRRDEKRRNFAQGQFFLFVTTTIMERGITVPKVNVIVLQADFAKVFDEGTLVQMAGRAGRIKEFDGQVIFSASRVTEAMYRAINNIRTMNKEAVKMGVLEE